MLAKKYRLTLSGEIKNVLKNGQKFKSPYFLLFSLKNRSQSPRFAVIASKKVGNAVERNLAKRKLREAIKLNFKQVQAAGNSYVLIAFNNTPETHVSKLSNALAEVLRNSKK
jgi:ribonuclease P protein component